MLVPLASTFISKRFAFGTRGHVLREYRKNDIEHGPTAFVRNELTSLAAFNVSVLVPVQLVFRDRWTNASNARIPLCRELTNTRAQTADPPPRRYLYLARLARKRWDSRTPALFTVPRFLLHSAFVYVSIILLSALSNRLPYFTCFCFCFCCGSDQNERLRQNRTRGEIQNSTFVRRLRISRINYVLIMLIINCNVIEHFQRIFDYA